jgi:apolipoprotein N-acyltransferase
MTGRGAATLLLLPAAAGALQTLAFVQTAAWPLPLAATALLAWLVARQPARGAALAGWAFGCGWLVASTWWLFVSMHRYGNIPAPLAALAVFALAAFLSLYLALACALFARWRSGRMRRDAPLFASLWLLAELARGVIFTGFPWVASGYAQVDGPLAALAPWVGVYGIGAWGALVAALVAGSTLRRPWPALVAVLMVAAAPALRAFEFSSPAGTLQVTLLQTNVPQDQKFAAEHMPQTLDWLARTLQAARGDLVVAPETAIPLLPNQLGELAPGWWDALRGHFAGNQGAAPTALVGLPLGDLEHGYTNSVAGLSEGPLYRYDKLHLVPFGEFIPFGFRWFTDAMGIPLGDFERGVRNPPSFGVRGQWVAPNICYEDLFGEELARRFADAALAPTMFANLSNIGWFGDTIAIPQHLNISRLRALEFERPMLRATNTGATAVIDHRGRVQAQLAAFRAGVLEASVEGRTGLTPFAAWAAHGGLWPLVAIGMVLPLRAAFGRRGAQ